MFDDSATWWPKCIDLHWNIHALFLHGMQPLKFSQSVKEWPIQFFNTLIINACSYYIFVLFSSNQEVDKWTTIIH